MPRGGMLVKNQLPSCWEGRSSAGVFSKGLILRMLLEVYACPSGKSKVTLLSSVAVLAAKMLRCPQRSGWLV